MEKTLSAQTWVITGATSGLGRAVALGLAQRGATVVTLNRNAATGAALRAELAAASGADQPAAYGADLAEQAALRRAAAAILADHPVLHGLINNAGVSVGRRHLTVDGHELNFAVNFLAPFLLTHLLLPALHAGAREGAPSRVINLATWRHPPLDFGDVRRERSFQALPVYGQSKTALVLFTQSLAQRLTDVTVNAVNPGLLRTHLGTDLTGMNWLFMKVIAPLTMMKTAAQGAAQVLRLADDPALAGVTGQFFNEGQIAPPFQVEPSPADRERLWRLGAELTGLGDPAAN